MRRRTLKAAQEWIRKASFLTSDLSGGTDGGLLNPQQATKFLQLITDKSELLGKFSQETSNAPQFDVPRITFHGGRVLKAGTEFTRLGDSDRVKPTTGLMTMSTALFRAEIPVSDELFEDNIERAGLADTLTGMIAEAVSRDSEEIILKSKKTATAHTDTAFAGFDGAFQLMDVASAALSTAYTATGVVDAESIFRGLFELLPYRYRRNPSELTFVVPDKLKLAYESSLRDRGTPLGDVAVENGRAVVKWNNIPIMASPLSSGAAEAGIGNIDYRKYAFICNLKNIAVGWQRKIRFEQYRDPREGGTSFLVTLRYTTGIYDVNALAFTKTLETSF